MQLIPDRVPPVLRGTRPQWWTGPDPLAYGPFVVENSGGKRLGIILKQPDAQTLVYSDADRQITLRLRRDPYVAGQKIFLRTEDGRVEIRPLRNSDRTWLVNADGTAVTQPDVLAAARVSFRW